MEKQKNSNVDEKIDLSEPKIQQRMMVKNNYTKTIDSAPSSKYLTKTAESGLKRKLERTADPDKSTSHKSDVYVYKSEPNVRKKFKQTSAQKEIRSCREKSVEILEQNKEHNSITKRCNSSSAKKDNSGKADCSGKTDIIDLTVSNEKRTDRGKAHTRATTKQIINKKSQEKESVSPNADLIPKGTEEEAGPSHEVTDIETNPTYCESGSMEADNGKSPEVSGLNCFYLVLYLKFYACGLTAAFHYLLWTNSVQ